LICSEHRHRCLFVKGGRDYLRCEGCGLVSVSPLPTPEALQAFYDEDYASEKGMGRALVTQEEMARATARYRLGVVRADVEGQRWLDVGCSTGLFLEELSRAGFRAEGIDLSCPAVAEAQSRGLRAWAATVEQFEAELPFDVVSGFDVIEHVLDPVRFLQAVRRLLRPGGTLVLTTPDTRSLTCRLLRSRWYFYLPHIHVFHFHRRNIARLLAREGYDVVRTARVGKALTYSYSLLQFQASNPHIHRVWKGLGALLPAAYHRRVFRVPIGEMIVVARKGGIGCVAHLGGVGMSAQRPERWGIIGGGLLGMALALRLSRQGRAVTLFESAGALGGLASAWELGGVTWDRHYHVTLLSDLALRSLLDDLGLDQEVRWVETKTGFFTDGKLYSLSNTWEFLRFPPLGLVDKLRLGATIFYASKVKDWRRLEKVPVGDWLRRWSGRRTFDKIWEPLLRAKLGPNYPRASAAFIWAIIARMYAARRSGLKKEMFGYVPGGYARVLSRFAEVLARDGVAVHLNHAARRVTPTPDGRLRVTFENMPAHTFDQVALTIPSPAAAHVCPSLPVEEKEKLRGIAYQGIICASLLLRRPLSPYYVTNITESWVPFTAVIEMSALVDRSHFGGHALVYLPKYVEPDDPTFALSDREIEARFLDALARMHPGFDRRDVVAFRVSRVRHVLPIATVGYSDRLPPMTTSIPGLHVVNSTHILNGTLNANETVQLAENAARKLLGRQAPPAGVPYRKAV
jgi:protoporphyrinogen oxidase/2-polyprenyl-3-methyl-5-hydroxy-6-metoxy-1,4-benzoquinol methylase